MPHTVKQLAKLSGLSVRTLHFYDEIGLLKPAYIGRNGYRYYEEDQLLILQQILIYRELDFPLEQVKHIIYDKKFNKIEALESHKMKLIEKLKRSEKMIETIDKTISHLKGDYPMKDSEFYYGFDSEKQKAHEKQLVESGIVSQEFMDECNEKVKNWTDEDKHAFIQSIDKIMNGLVQKMLNGIQPSKPEVQDLMQKHYDWLVRSWCPDKNGYLGLMDLYQTPEFRVFFDKFHPSLLDYLLSGMKVYAEKLL
jgi:DNA-binding transcriptional MerR regulator